MSTEKNRISIFDLDGTLTKSDTYLPYLMGFLVRNPMHWLKAVILPFAVLMFYCKLRGNEWLKITFLSVVFGGESKKKINDWNEVFIDRLFKNGLREDIVKILEERQKAGDIVILSTASLDKIIIFPIIPEWLNDPLLNNL